MRGRAGSLHFTIKYDIAHTGCMCIWSTWCWCMCMWVKGVISTFQSLFSWFPLGYEFFTCPLTSNLLLWYMVYVPHEAFLKSNLPVYMKISELNVGHSLNFAWHKLAVCRIFSSHHAHATVFNSSSLSSSYHHHLIIMVMVKFSAAEALLFASVYLAIVIEIANTKLSVSLLLFVWFQKFNLWPINFDIKILHKMLSIISTSP
mgnify:CR=1 FL=1